MYQVKIEQFEGPFDLLLEIIEAKKLPLVELSLSKITDQFFEHLKTVSLQDPSDLVEFLVVASHLVLLKSRELVPDDTNEVDKEGSIQELERRLALYQPFRTAAKELGKSERARKMFFAREAFVGFKNIFFFPSGLKTYDIFSSIEAIVAEITLPERIPQARIKDFISMQICIERLQSALAEKGSLEFKEFVQDKKEEDRMIYFLGVLELDRLGKINTEQKTNFGRITLGKAT